MDGWREDAIGVAELLQEGCKMEMRSHRQQQESIMLLACPLLQELASLLPANCLLSC